MIEQVSIANFKAIGPSGVDLRLAPLTIFVGPNGSGKSSVLEGVALLAQCARAGRAGNISGLATDGPLVQFGEDVTALYHNRLTEKELRLGLTWRHSEASEIGCSLAVREAQKVFDGDWRQGLHSGNSRIEFYKGTSGQRVVARMSGDPTAETRVGGQIERFLSQQLFMYEDSNPPPEVVRGLTLWKANADLLAGFFSSTRLRYLSALRGGQLMEEEPKGEATTAGLHGLNTQRLLNAIKTIGSRDKRKRLDEFAARFGMPDLTAGYSGDGRLRTEFEADAATGARLPVFHAGFGSQYALPVIADLVDADPGTTLFIEEIEHSSHPAWMHQWGLTLAEAAGAWGLQIVTTTHAPALVLAVALAVRKGLLRPDQVAVYEFTRNNDVVGADRLEFDKAGRLDRGWISTFAQAESKLLDDLLADDDRDESVRSPA
jgi:predicted ATPase